ncbi:MAG: Hydroxyacylglutathione hydrolase GloC [Dehalococcoidia bacterium]|nr:Hydroxyacylglutathione hydrolase GloC [Chloroflexota bacterium]
MPIKPDILLNDGDTISFGNIELHVLHTPGHTPGSVCFLTGNHLISGDTIFPSGPGRTGSPDQLRQIIESITSKILVLPDDTRVYPGHGDSTTDVLARICENHRTRYEIALSILTKSIM